MTAYQCDNPESEHPGFPCNHFTPDPARDRVVHAANPHNPPEPSGYADADFQIGQRVWVALEPEPCVITGLEPHGQWVIRAADGVEMNATANMMSPAAAPTCCNPHPGRPHADGCEHEEAEIRPAAAKAPADVPSNAPYAGDDTKYRTPRNGGRCPGCGLVMSVREGAEQGRCNECLTGPSLTAPGYGH